MDRVLSEPGLSASRSSQNVETCCSTTMGSHGSIDFTLSESTLSTPYLCHNVDNSKLNTGPSFRHSSSIQKRPWNHFGSKNEDNTRRSSVTIPPASENGTGSEIISKLFHATLEFWSMILSQESWSLRSAPGPLVDSSALDGPDSYMKDVEETKPGGEDVEMTTASKTPEPAEGLDPGCPQYEQNCWDMVRDRLSEERDRLVLWKSRFSGENLDLLRESQSNLYIDLGNSILEALLSIANSILADASK